MSMGDHSRALLLGSRATGRTEPDLRRRLEASTVLVTVDREVDGAVLTARVLLTTLRRLPIGLMLAPGGLPSSTVDEIAGAVRRIDSRRGLRIGDGLRAPDGPCSAHVHIGVKPVGPGVIRAVPDGYGAHVARNAAAVVRTARSAHPLGSIYTAAMAAAEVFKDVAEVLEGRRVDHGHLTWCPVALSPDLTVAPMQRERLRLDLALAGCGAIGTASALILQELNAEGDILLIDRQRFARENLATYSLGDQRSVRGRPWKVNLVGSHLSRYRVRRLRARVEDLPAMVDRGEVRWPHVVLGGLDSPEARRELQLLWPDRLIDGGTSDTAVALHDVVAGDGPCLICFFPPRDEDLTIARLAEMTGLSADRLARGEDVLTAEELEARTPEQQALLEPMIGRPVCGLARAIGLVDGDAGGYQPAVPFVAQQAAAHVIGRLLAIRMGMRPAGNFVEYDALIGPRPDAVDERNAGRHCYCQVKARRIQRVRESRARGAAAAGSF